MAAMMRLPDRMPRLFFKGLAVAAATYSIGMGIDFVRLDRDRARFVAGISAVPEGARLLPLIFRAKGTSQNTRSLLHAWGYYVTEKQTSAPLLFAHSRSFLLMYREPPPPQFNHLSLEPFAPTMGDAGWTCGVQRAGGVIDENCEGAWRARWADFWRQATPRFDHVLLWEPSAEALAQVPSAYHQTFRQDGLIILERGPDWKASLAASDLDVDSSSRR
jgi:hypothetical protein